MHLPPTDFSLKLELLPTHICSKSDLFPLTWHRGVVKGWFKDSDKTSFKPELCGRNVILGSLSIILLPISKVRICLDSRFLCNVTLYRIWPCFYHQSHPQLGMVFPLAPSLHSFWSYFSTDADWASTDLGSSSFSVLSFCLLILFMGVSRWEYWSGLPVHSPVDHILSEWKWSNRRWQEWMLTF